MKNGIFLFIILLFFGCNSINQIIEESHIISFEAKEIRIISFKNDDFDVNENVLQLSGLIGMSSTFYDKLEIIENDNEMYIFMYGTIIKKEDNSSGSFFLLVPLNDNINIVFFGNEKSIIWERSKNK